MKKTLFLIVGLLAVLSFSAAMIGTPTDAQVAQAAMRGDRDAVKALLQRGTDVNIALSDGMTALHYAAALGDAQMAEMLLYAGANVSAKTRLNEYTPLHIASESGSTEVVKLLLNAGADVNAKTTVSGVRPIHLAAKSGKVDAVNALLERGADPNAKEAEWEQTPLIFAAATDRADVIAALLARGADPNITAKGMAFPAGGRGRGGRGGDPPAPGAPGAPTPGAPAAAAAANPTAPAAAAPAPGAPGAPAAPQAAAGGRGGQRPDPNDDTPVGRGTPGMGGLSPLHHAARQGNLAAVRALLDGGADINKTTFDSTTPLAISLLNSQWDVAMELTKRGSDVNKPLTYVNASPLWLAINAQWQPRTRFPQPQEGGYQKSSYLEVMEALLDKGADPNFKVSGHPFFMEYTGCGNGRCGLEDMTNSTPFMRAAYSLDVPAMKLLIKRGANMYEGVAVAGNGGFNFAAQGIRNADPNQPAGAAAATPPADVPRGTDGLPLAPTTVNVPTGDVLAIHYVAGEGYGEGFAGNAHMHAPDAWLAAIKYVVEELHQDVNARDNTGMTALHHAAARGDVDMILYLVSKGADVTAVSTRGQTVADMANSPVSRISPFPTVVALLQALGSGNSHKCTQC